MLVPSSFLFSLLKNNYKGSNWIISAQAKRWTLTKVLEGQGLLHASRQPRLLPLLFDGNCLAFIYCFATYTVSLNSRVPILPAVDLYMQEIRPPVFLVTSFFSLALAGEFQPWWCAEL